MTTHLFTGNSNALPSAWDFGFKMEQILSNCPASDWTSMIKLHILKRVNWNKNLLSFFFAESVNHCRLKWKNSCLSKQMNLSDRKMTCIQTLRVCHSFWTLCCYFIIQMAKGSQHQKTIEKWFIQKCHFFINWHISKNIVIGKNYSSFYIHF